MHRRGYTAQNQRQGQVSLWFPSMRRLPSDRLKSSYEMTRSRSHDEIIIISGGVARVRRYENLVCDLLTSQVADLQGSLRCPQIAAYPSGPVSGARATETHSHSQSGMHTYLCCCGDGGLTNPEPWPRGQVDLVWNRTAHCSGRRQKRKRQRSALDRASTGSVVERVPVVLGFSAVQ